MGRARLRGAGRGPPRWRPAQDPLLAQNRLDAVAPCELDLADLLRARLFLGRQEALLEQRVELTVEPLMVLPEPPQLCALRKQTLDQRDVSRLHAFRSAKLREPPRGVKIGRRAGPAHLRLGAPHVARRELGRGDAAAAL